jgi:hypothetical protein
MGKIALTHVSPTVYIRTLTDCKGYTLETWDEVSDRGLLWPATLVKNHKGLQQSQNYCQHLSSLPSSTESPLNLVQIKANGSVALILNRKFPVGTEKKRGRDRSVVIATGWTVRGSNLGGRRDFSHTSIPVLGSNQPPVQ